MSYLAACDPVSWDLSDLIPDMGWSLEPLDGRRLIHPVMRSGRRSLTSPGMNIYLVTFVELARRMLCLCVSSPLHKAVHCWSIGASFSDI